MDSRGVGTSGRGSGHQIGLAELYELMQQWHNAAEDEDDRAALDESARELVWILEGWGLQGEARAIRSGSPSGASSCSSGTMPRKTRTTARRWMKARANWYGFSRGGDFRARLGPSDRARRVVRAHAAVAQCRGRRGRPRGAG